MQTPIVKGFFDTATHTISYLVWDPETCDAMIIDSVLNYDAASGSTTTSSADQIVNAVNTNALTVLWHLETHVHADHLSAAAYLQRALGGKIGIGHHIQSVQSVFTHVYNIEDDCAADGSQFDQLFKDGDSFALGNLTVQIMHTPGHTPACVSYLIGDSVFVGDTLFMPDYGTARCDFPGGDARILYRSIQKLLDLPGQTRVFLCHDYLPKGRKTHCWETTIEAQQKNNVHVKNDSLETEFVTMRRARDKLLAVPKLILPAIQVNIRAGHLPAQEDNGVTYLKIPINQF